MARTVPVRRHDDRRGLEAGGGRYQFDGSDQLMLDFDPSTLSAALDGGTAFQYTVTCGDAAVAIALDASIVTTCIVGL
jgi:hypothetical protein